jgi:tetratricopeptide (TPR) repeat protein
MIRPQRAAVFVLVLPLCLPRAATAQRLTDESIAALREWVSAVEDHVPGRADAAVRHVAGLRYSVRVELNKSYSQFIKALPENFAVTRSEDDENEVILFARAVRQRAGVAAFLKRAAMLHTDALIFAGQFPAPIDDAPPPPPRAQRDAARRSDPPPLLFNEVIALARDGEVFGDGKADWHLRFARSLLDVMLTAGRGRVSEDDRRFVAEWYHAVSAFFFANGNYADSTPHLLHAARVLPDDADVLFDRASYAETFGLPIYQHVLEDPNYYGRPGYQTSGIPIETKTNEEAERLYRRTLTVDPSYVEARIRLARLLDRRGQHDEAAAEITAALEAKPAGVALFFAHIIAGRIASSRGRYDDALREYRAASALYPNAQSALLGASHAALMLANVGDALGPLQQLPGNTIAADEDPLLDYELGAGRDVDALLKAVRSRLVG